MNKFITMLFSTLMAFSFASAQSIPQEILGVKIGETMQEDAHNILIEQNLEYDWKYDNTYYSKGEIKHEGIKWHEIREAEEVQSGDYSVSIIYDNSRDEAYLDIGQVYIGTDEPGESEE